MKRNIKGIYDIFAGEYDEAHFGPNSAAGYVEKRRQDLIYPYLQKSKGLRVIDVACGTGTYLAITERIGAKVVGCDISKNMIHVCKKKGLKNVSVGDYQKLPFEDGSFDLVLCINSIHYSNNPKKVLNEMSGVLIDDGIILFSYFNILNFRYLNYVRRVYKKNHPICHEHRYFSFQMSSIFKKIGLKSIYLCGIDLLPFPSNSKPRNKKFLNVCSEIEGHTNKTPLMHFFNEVFVVLKKKDFKQINGVILRW